MQIGIFITVIIVIALILIASKKVCDMAIKADTAKKYSNFIFSAEPQNEYLEETEKNIKWLEENTEETQIISKDGLKLVGYERKISPQTKNWVIAVHGYTGRGSDMVQYIKQFEKLGFNSLIIDLRSHGKSEGKYIGMGWLDHYDLELWIEKIIQENKNCKIILYGISMGAATVTMATGDTLPGNVKLCIADCGYSSVWDEFKVHLKKLFHIPAFPILHIANIMSKLIVGYSFKEASSIEQVKKSKIPTLFIHGCQDKFVPYEMLDKIYNNAGCKKEKLEIEGAKHAESSNIDAEKYWKSIRKFVNENI